MKKQQTRRREERILRKKLAALERQLLDYFGRHPGTLTDGSFMHHVYRLGYEARRRQEKREMREGQRELQIEQHRSQNENG